MTVAFSTRAHVVYHSSRRSSFSSASNSDSRDSSSINIEELQQRIAQFNNGIPINVQSPKQVSLAVFGRPQSAAKGVLELAVVDHQLTSEKRQLAQLILECRTSMQQRETRRSFSSTATSDSISTVSRPQLFTASTHEQIVDSLFDRPRSKLDEYWRDPLKLISRPVARELLKQLDATECPMGFDPTASPKKKAVVTVTAAGKKGSFLAFCREQKRLYPQCVILTRMGDFYETFGIDAILLVEHVGLNPMGGKVKAGCPYRNVQATLNGLTDQGFSVAVYEEVGQTASNKLKTRVLSQIVSPASPTYLYDQNWLLGSDHDSGAALEQLPPSRPCVGIVHTAAGYHLAEVSLEERSVEYSERLTPEAVSCRLAAYPPAEPLVYIPSPTESVSSSLPFLPHSMRPSTNLKRDMVEAHFGGYRLRTVILPPHLIPTTDGSESERYINVIVEALLQWNEKRQDEGNRDIISSSRKPGSSISEKRLSHKDFTVSQSFANTQPLYMETASQLGLLQDPAIPSLIAHVLDEAAPAATRRFLKRYLLVPPPPEVAQSMAKVVKSLLDDNSSNAVLPRLTVPPLGKILSLVRAGQASATIYGELLHTIAVTRFVVSSPMHNLPVHALMTLCSHESGLVAEQESLALRCQQVMDVIEAIICPSHHVDDEILMLQNKVSQFTLEDPLTHYQYLPDAFVERNELTWRGRVQRVVAEQAYQKVEDAGHHLDAVIARDFIKGDDSNRGLIVQDIFNNLLALKKVPTNGESKDYIHPRDRHGKKLSTRYSTEHVQQAVSDYVTACDAACEEVSSVLSCLAKTLQDDGHMPAIIQSAHLNLALSAAYHHAVKANKQNWHLAETIEPELEMDENAISSPAPKLIGLWPYWMLKSQGVPNTFNLKGMFLLTAPNMSGKSTLMRSTAAAVLLTVCGLCAPLEAGSCVPRFDTLFLRGASADVPAENKSAFGAEMEDMAALMRCCGPRSLVFVDEIGRGTSPRDGARLAAAILEAMSSRGMSGIFATHLHDILNLPLRAKDRITTKQMAIARSNTSSAIESYEWTYRLEDGICNDSLAMVTAARFGLPDEIIRRADELDHYLPNNKVLSDVTHTMQRNGGMVEIMKNNHSKSQHDFQKAVALAEQTVAQSFTTLPPKANPPPALANKSCVYLLQLSCDPPRYYVGETDAIFQRLKSHRSKGPAWSTCRAAVLRVSSKSEARRFESRLIQHLAQAGLSLESTRDGRTFRQ